MVEGTIQSEGSLTGDDLRARVAEVFADEEKRSFVLDLAPTANHSGPRTQGYAHDLELSPDHTEHAAATLPHAEVLMLATGTHLAFFTHPRPPGRRPGRRRS